MSLHIVKWNAQLLDVPKSIKRFPIKHMEMKFINVCTVFLLGSNQEQHMGSSSMIDLSGIADFVR
jgi:hypothetical protein